ncbi:MAG: hypothetical protein ACRCW2_10820 [Cellulosilyticaceae bacterium]
MIAVWNRKEVYVGQSMEKCAEVRQELSDNDIPYTYNAVDRNNSQIMGASRSGRGTWGQDSKYTYTYYVYVHKNDYEFASFIVGRLNG